MADDEGDLPGDTDTTCLEVMQGRGAWEVAEETDPADGSTVEADQVITSRITWLVDDFADDVPLYSTLACVTIDGRLDETLSADERQATNDGEFVHTFTVPDGLAAGTEICNRGAVVGDGGGYFERNKSNDVCFTVAEGDRTQPGVEVPVPSAPPAEAPPVPVAPTADVAPGTQVLGETAEQPAVAPAPAPGWLPQAVAELPRTGPGDRPLTAAAGLLLVVGGAAIGGSAKRRRTDLTG